MIAAIDHSASLGRAPRINRGRAARHASTASARRSLIACGLGPLRGHPPCVPCTTGEGCIERLQYDDYAIARAPGLQNSGCCPACEC
eukprot:8385584-Pyramimonas_sp.AAC.1